MSTPTESLLDHVIELAQDALRAARLSEGESRLHYLVQARVHVAECIVFAEILNGPRRTT